MSGREQGMAGQLIRWGRRSREERAATRGARVPFLASDARRTVIAFLLSLIPGTAFDDLLDHIDFGPDELMSDLSIILCSFLVGWIFFAGVYALLTMIVFARADGETFGHWLRETLPKSWIGRVFHITSGGSSTIWTAHGSMIAVIAVLVLSLVPDLRSSPLVVASGVVAVAASWLMNTVSFAVHYARKDAIAPGLRFPEGTAPVFGDYFYLAVQVATSYGVGDVATLSRPMRRAITAQTMLSFLFNTVIIAVLVSVLISAA